MTDIATVERIIAGDSGEAQHLFFDNKKFIDLEPLRNRLQDDWRSASQLSSIVGEVRDIAPWLSPDKRFQWINLLRISVEHCLGQLSPDVLRDVYDIAVIWSDKKLQQMLRHRFDIPGPDRKAAMRQTTDDYDQRNILLAPLTKQDMVEFYWQYGQVDTLKTLGLPVFDSNESFLNWAGKNYSKQSFTDLIHHQEWGVIGMTRIQSFDDLALLTFWVGSDFRHQGTGSHAVKCLLKTAMKRFRCKAIYAHVQQSNIAARRTLINASFNRVMQEFESPWEQDFFYRYGNEVSSRKTYTELKRLHQYMELPIKMVEQPGKKDLMHSLQQQMEALDKVK